MYLRFLFASIAALTFAGGAATAQSTRTTTGGAMLLGEWQNEASGMALHCLPGKVAILETSLTKDGATTSNYLGSYRGSRPGVWELTLSDPHHKSHSYTLTFDGGQRLLLHKGTDAPLVFLRSGIRFDQLDRDGDGWISKNEAKETPLYNRFDEFTSGKDRQVDRRGFERFLEKYPQLGAKK